MIDQILNMAKSQLGDKVKQVAGLNESQLEKTYDVAGDSVMEGLKEQALGGGLSGVLSAFNGNASQSLNETLTNKVASNFVGKMITRVGVNEQQAKQISDILIPFVMEKFSSKDTGNAEDEKELASKLGMDKDNDLGDLLGGFLGKSKKDGGLLGGLF